LIVTAPAPFLTTFASDAFVTPNIPDAKTMGFFIFAPKNVSERFAINSFFG